MIKNKKKNRTKSLNRTLEHNNLGKKRMKFNFQKDISMEI